MLFRPTKVSLKVLSILFKVTWAYCEGKLDLLLRENNITVMVMLKFGQNLEDDKVFQGMGKRRL